MNENMKEQMLFQDKPRVKTKVWCKAWNIRPLNKKKVQDSGPSLSLVEWAVLTLCRPLSIQEPAAAGNVNPILLGLSKCASCRVRTQMTICLSVLQQTVHSALACTCVAVNDCFPKRSVSSRSASVTITWKGGVGEGGDCIFHNYRKVDWPWQRNSVIV